jgi:hypothetical protein
MDDMAFDHNKMEPAPGEWWIVATLGVANGATETVRVVQEPSTDGRVRVLRTVVAYVDINDFLEEIEE